jgi:hypothetical protein
MTHLPEPVQAAIHAANAGDLIAFLADFTPDGVVDDWGREFHGGAQITGWSDAEFIGKQVTLAVEAVERDAEGAYVVTAAVGGNGFNGPSHFAFLVDDSSGKIRRMTIRA